MNIYWKAACAVGIAIVAFFGGWHINGQRMQKRVDAIQAAHDQAVLDAERAVRAAEQKASFSVNHTATEYQQRVASIARDNEQLKKELKNAQSKNPMPDNCRLDDERMRIIKTATDRANAVNPGIR